MVDWATVSSLATALGTLVLALATFSSVRAANRSAKVSELALQSANRPTLVNSHIYDPEDKIRFLDDRWVKVKGGHAHASATKDVIYFVISVRNAGQGMAVLDRWVASADSPTAGEDLGDIDSYRRLTRDLYIEAGQSGLWQGSIRDPKYPHFAKLAEAIANRDTIRIDIEYADQEGGQRTVSRFALTPAGEEKDDWLVSTVRHWRLDGVNPR